MGRRLISKSKYVAGLQCEKLLWNHYNRKDRIPPHDPDTLWIFEQGHAVGALAQRLAPGGGEVPFGRMMATVEATRTLLERRIPVYEASFAAGHVYCRVDILQPAADGKWDLLEVKSSTRVKDVNLDDIAVQAHALEAAGLELDRLFLVHVDRDYVRGEEIVPADLFHAEDVTEDVRARSSGVGPRLERFVEVLDGPEPDVPIGAHCTDPYECPLKPHCWAHLPADDPTTLTRAGAKGLDWVARGIARAVDVPHAELTERQRIQSDALRTGEPHIDAASIRKWLDQLNHPLIFLDFEAFATAIPLIVGTSPYEAIPFQASVHLVMTPGDEPTHLEFLATDPQDPRPALAEFLAALPTRGSVVAWHASYERKILRQLADRFPEHATALLSLVDRLVDLEEPFRRFQFHHPAQRGSSSIKAVLPAVTEAGYAGDAIEGGRQAERAFLSAVHGDAPESERDDVLRALRDYCRKDTLSMVQILSVLER